MTELYLASQSPRRADLLRQMAVDFEVLRVQVPETPEPAEPAQRYVARVALAKAEAGRRHCPRPDLPVLGADTAVVLDDGILGKPADEDEAAAFLARLSGQRHQVMTAVAVVGNRTECAINITEVRFRTLDAAEIHRYVNTGEPMDKAGGYGIQGLGGVFVQSLNGSYSSVVGLPLFETAGLLAPYGLPRNLR